MEYKQMILDARKKGLTNENKMWESIASINEGLVLLEQSHPDMYWKLMREQARIMFDGHYTEEFAKYDIDKMHSTDKAGAKHRGAHWSKEEVLAATASKTFPTGVTADDKWVAYNAMWHDLNSKFDDAQILDAAYLFFFADEDWAHPGTKVWDYMSIS